MMAPACLRAALCAIALAGMLVFVPVGARAEALSGPALTQGTVVQATLSAEGMDFPIETAPGDYLAGSISGEGQPITADLLFPDGRPFRRLADAASGTIRFQAMAESTGLVLRISGAGAVEISLEARIAFADQIPAPRDYASPRIAQLAADLADGGISEGFWQEVVAKGTPLVERVENQTIMTFLWRGASRNVRLFGGPSNDHEWLERLEASDVWFKSFAVPEGTRLSYQLAPDVPDIPGNARTRRGALLATVQVDPLNRTPAPTDAPDRFAQEATVSLPDAPEQPGWPPAPDADPEVNQFTFDSPRLGNSRQITISHPKGLNPADPDLVLLFLFDGEKALTKMQAPQLMETLTRQGQLPAVVTVLIPAIDSATRSRELPDSDLFADVLAQDLLPEVLARTGMRHDPTRTVLAGASYGGLASATIALRHPEAFGNVLSMSGSFWWAPEGHAAAHPEQDGTPYVAQRLAASARLPLRIFLSAGDFETGRDGTGGILETSRSLRDILRLKGYETHWRRYAGGHDYIIWRGALADGMIALFGR